MVGLASLAILPHYTVEAPTAGVLEIIDADTARVTATSDGQTTMVSRLVGESGDDWQPVKWTVDDGATVASGQVLAKTDSERAYVVMMTRYLRPGLLGLVAASLLTRQSIMMPLEYGAA